MPNAQQRADIPVYPDRLTLEHLTVRLERDRWDASTAKIVLVKERSRKGTYYYVRQWAAQSPKTCWYIFQSGACGNVQRSWTGWTPSEWQSAIIEGKIVLLSE